MTQEMNLRALYLKRAYLTPNPFPVWEGEQSRIKLTDSQDKLLLPSLCSGRRDDGNVLDAGEPNP
jgi:hypothetical protein